MVCSRNAALLAALKENIEATIDFNYELIVVDNTIFQQSLCSVYNHGLAAATGKYCCFCHEDILFETKGWGRELVSLLNNGSIGLAGAAGAIFKSRFPASWVAVPQQYYRINMIQRKAGGEKVPYKILDEGNFSEVAVLDGFFMAGRKEVFDEFPWNEGSLNGFDMYDIDISVRVRQKYRVVVANTITIEHLSEGNFSERWLTASENFHRDNQALLPAYTDGFDKKQMAALEYYALVDYINKLLRFKKTRQQAMKYIVKAFTLKPFSKPNITLVKALLKSRK
ncbi:glycosyltransferase [Ferruginibacter sp. HRS2-29]|uniref:glycosyltransferase n=1 Tax=Ferruginibacter sp. HRS2-29 TaxID=2487334 RepID=UPI0020CD888D